MTTDIPYFMSNEKWYRFSKSAGRYVLTDEAPKDAVESYETFYKQLGDVNGM